MKRYIKSSGSSSDSRLVSALVEVLLSTLDMGDYVEDLVEGLADLGNIELPEEYDADTMLTSVLTQLVAQQSSAITDYIIYPFTEYPEMLLEDISIRTPSGKDSKLYKAIQVIYDHIGEFPGGDAVKSAIAENIFSSELISGNAAEVGYAIGNLYWKYIKSEEYGVRSNFASAVGVSHGCREAIGGKYKYAFMQDISSYYYSDLREEHPEMPSATGFMLKFYDYDNTTVCADVFNLFQNNTWDIGNQVIYTFTFNNIDDAGIDAAAREVAAWYDAHVQDAIDAALNYAG